MQLVNLSAYSVEGFFGFGFCFQSGLVNFGTKYFFKTPNLIGMVVLLIVL